MVSDAKRYVKTYLNGTWDHSRNAYLKWPFFVKRQYSIDQKFQSLRESHNQHITFIHFRGLHHLRRGAEQKFIIQNFVTSSAWEKHHKSL